MSILYTHTQGDGESVVVKDDRAGYCLIRIDQDGQSQAIILDPDECRKLAAAVYAPIADLLVLYTDREIDQMIADASWQRRLEREAQP